MATLRHKLSKAGYGALARVALETLLLGAGVVACNAVPSHERSGPGQPAAATVRPLLPPAPARAREDESAAADASGTIDGSFLFSGCRLVRLPATCELMADDELTLWTGDAAVGEQQTLRVDGQPTPQASRLVVEGGVQYRLVPGRFGALTLNDANGSELAGLRLVEHRPFAGLAEAQRLRRAQNPSAALPLIEQAERSDDPELQNRGRALRARVLLDLGEPEPAAAILEESRVAAYRLGRASDAVNDSFALVFILAERLGDVARARGVLDEVRPWVRALPHLAAGHAYYSGAVARQLEYLEEARHQFRAALRIARRTGDASRGRDSALLLATIDADLGRVGEAVRLLEAELEQAGPTDSCARAHLHAALGWIGLESDAGVPSAAQTREHLRAAVERWSPECGSVADLRNALVNLGSWALAQGDLGEAESVRERLVGLQGGNTGQVLVWEREFLGRLSLRRGQSDAALEAFRGQAALAEARANTYELQRALVGQGDVLWQQGARALAIECYERADRLATESIGLPRTGSARSALLGLRDTAARRLVDARLAEGRADQAYVTAALAFTRTLGRSAVPARSQTLGAEARREWEVALSAYHSLRSQIDARVPVDWSASAEELRLHAARTNHLRERAERQLRIASRLLDSARPHPEPPLERADEVLLCIFPGTEQWWGFLRSEGRVEARPLGSDSVRAPAEALQRWLDELTPRLAGARRLAVMPYGKAAELDIAKLVASGVRGRGVLSVVHRVGLTTAAVAPSQPFQALVIGDPRDNLRAARMEAYDVKRWLVSGVQLLVGAEATRPAVLGALQHASFFHYSGHSAAAVGDGGGLLLANDGELTASDVLTLPTPPRSVILSSCDAASGTRRAGGWSLAHAFILAGSAEVVAASGEIDDVAASRLQALLYQSRAADPGASLASALAAAQAIAGDEGVPGWSAFRAFEP